MAKFNKDEKKEISEEIFFHTEKDIQSTRVTMCSQGEHDWRKFSDTEIACRRCPTINIVTNAKDYGK